MEKSQSELTEISMELSSFVCFKSSIREKFVHEWEQLGVGNDGLFRHHFVGGALARRSWDRFGCAHDKN